MNGLTRNGTNGRVYGGDENLIHVRDGHRGDVGRAIAACIDKAMREEHARAGKSLKNYASMLLCPGCYMAVIFNAAVITAINNKQPLKELAASMATLFIGLYRAIEMAEQSGADEKYLTEHVKVLFEKPDFLHSLGALGHD